MNLSVLLEALKKGNEHPNSEGIKTATIWVNAISASVIAISSTGVIPVNPDLINSVSSTVIDNLPLISTIGVAFWNVLSTVMSSKKVGL